MQYIGKIITDNIKDVREKAYDFIEVVKSEAKLPESENFTLIIGKDKAREMYGKERVKLTQHNIVGNIYWAPSKMENRNGYNEGIAEFNKKVFEHICKSIDYEYFDVFNISLSEIKRAWKFLKESDKKKIFFYTNDHLYLFCKEINITGISLRDLEYIGIDRKKIATLLSKNPHNIFFNNKFFLSEKLQEKTENNNIIIPYLYFLLN